MCSTETISLGALGDSFYEYLIKSWLITSKNDIEARDMFYDAIDVSKILCVCVCLYLCFVCMCIIYVCVFTSIYSCMCVYMHVCVCLSVYKHIHVCVQCFMCQKGGGGFETKYIST